MSEQKSRQREQWVRAGVAALAAVAGNVVAFAVASRAGATWDVGQAQPVAVPAVVGASVVSFAAGTALVQRLSRGRAHVWTRWAAFGLGFALLSAPGGYISSQEAATGLGLGAMHLISGVAWFVFARSTASRIGAVA